MGTCVAIHLFLGARPRYDKKMAQGGKAYDSMNSVAAHMLTNLTASMRFPGLLNIDLNEITTARPAPADGGPWCAASGRAPGPTHTPKRSTLRSHPMSAVVRGGWGGWMGCAVWCRV